jgi:putative integral membrane protein (TIGR02587 family)
MDSKKTAINYARGLMGGLILGVPVLLTMEVWWEGFFVPAWRLMLLAGYAFGVLFILQHYSGVTHQKTLAAEARAALVTMGLGIVVSLLILVVFGVVRDDMTVRDLAGKLILQAIPVSIGASVAMSEFGEEHRVIEERRKRAGYWGTLGMALAGATLFGFGPAAVEEPLTVADQLTWWRAIGLVLLSIIQVHAVVYAVDFKQRPEDVGTRQHWMEVIRESISTYAVAALVALYFLWTYRTIEGLGVVSMTYVLVVTAFVTSLGAAAAELLI